MAILAQEIIRSKRFGKVLTDVEISGFFNGFLKGEVADYQVSAMLMAILLKGMNEQEASVLTRVMRDSGTILSWPGPPREIVDKHSTGGVGDKTSLIILPLCILEGLYVPMIAGRGLGHTGGTLDKLESISGMNVFPSSDEARRLMSTNHGAFMGQTEEIAPLDKRLYAMRDVTDTVESIPLITASILSKKLAEGIGCLVMDVKYGSGAFMRAKEDALALAKSIAAVGQASGLLIRCALTDMDSPLGDRAGNSLEVVECVEVLKGQGPTSTRDLSVELTIEMICLSRPKSNRAEVRERLQSYLKNGSAYETFAKVIRSQGGDVRQLENTELFPKAPVRYDVIASKSGFISKCDVRQLGLAIVELGGGRRKSSDKINPKVGLSNMKRVGDPVEKGQPLLTIHAETNAQAESIVGALQAAYQVSDVAHAEPLVWQIFN
ncbi:MAG: thymidine phosphorylase [Proteobacteria bacterium]|nr:thymidine phosphorylase [Pseudomonadota bacterium]